MSNYLFTNTDSSSVYRVGYSIYITFGTITINEGKLPPAHINNFIEILPDGSAKLRVIIHNNDPKEFNINMFIPYHYIKTFQLAYHFIFGEMLHY